MSSQIYRPPARAVKGTIYLLGTSVARGVLMVRISGVEEYCWSGVVKEESTWNELRRIGIGWLMVRRSTVIQIETYSLKLESIR